jgi:F-type H+-transporting ATPase subunit delta
MPIVEKRYAEALAELSEKSASIDIVRSQFGDFVKIMSENFSLKSFIKDPRTSKKIKKITLNQILSGKATGILINLINLLIDKGRIDILQPIYNEFCIIADKKKSILGMTIITPFPLEIVQLEKIKQKYKQQYNASGIKEEVIINPALIGGIQVKIGDRLIDNSLSARLHDLKNYLNM